MANIMTKRGQLDNVITYQHFCDTTADLANIESKYCTLGSIAIVLQGDSGGLQIYIANSDKQWNPLTSGIGGGNGGGVANLPLEIVNPSNDDVLTYDSASGKWVNKAATSGGFGGVLVVHSVQDASGQHVLDKTWQEIYDAFVSNIEVFLVFEWTETGASGMGRFSLQIIGNNDDHNDYMVDFGTQFSAQTPSGYPVERQ